MYEDFPPGSSGLLGLIRSAIKAVPAVRYALAVAAIGAAVALIAGFTIDLRVAVFGIIILFVFMAVMVVFARLASVAAGSLYVLAMVLAWAAVILVISTSILLLTSVFFNWPRPLSRWIEGTAAVTPTASSNFVLTIYVHGPGGPYDRVLKSKGSVLLNIGGAPRSASIGPDGEAIFPEIPSNFRGQNASVGLDSEEYEMSDPSETIRLDGKSTYLAVRKKSGQITVHVQDEKGAPLAGVEIFVAGQTKLTDRHGDAEILIPGDKMKPELAGTAILPGYDTWSADNLVPNSNGLTIVLTKR